MPLAVFAALERAATENFEWTVYPDEARALVEARRAERADFARRLALVCFERSKRAKAAAKEMHARGDAAGGYYNEGFDHAMEQLAHQLTGDLSRLLKEPA